MDILTFISNLIDTLAWPIVVIFIAFIFRSPLTNLINRIRSVEKDGDKYRVDLDKATKDIKDISEKNVPREVQTLVHESPKEALQRSWVDLETSASSATNLSLGSSPLKIADTLVATNYLSENEGQAYYELAKLKNEALGEKTYITDSTSGYYASVAYTLANKIKGKKT